MEGKTPHRQTNAATAALDRLMAEFAGRAERREFGGYEHNTMRFNVTLAHSWPMFEVGEMDKDALVADIRQAIVDVVTLHSDASPESVRLHPCQDKPVRHATDQWLHHETIHYGFD